MVMDIQAAVKQKQNEQQKAQVMGTILELASEINFHEELLATIAYLLLIDFKYRRHGIEFKEGAALDEAGVRLEKMYEILKSKPAPDDGETIQ